MAILQSVRNSIELRIKVNSPILLILTLKLVAMATSLERSKKGVKLVIYDQIPTNDENFVKMGRVDLAIICLQGLF